MHRLQHAFDVSVCLLNLWKLIDKTTWPDKAWLNSHSFPEKMNTLFSSVVNNTFSKVAKSSFAFFPSTTSNQHHGDVQKTLVSRIEFLLLLI